MARQMPRNRQVRELRLGNRLFVRRLVDDRGLIWLDDSLQNTFGSFPVGGGNFSFSNSPGSHPHDGLKVDSQNRIWFDEEFANRLAEVVQSPS